MRESKHNMHLAVVLFLGLVARCSLGVLKQLHVNGHLVLHVACAQLDVALVKLVQISPLEPRLLQSLGLLTTLLFLQQLNLLELQGL